MAKSIEESAIYKEIMRLSDPGYLADTIFGAIPSFPLGAESYAKRAPTMAESLMGQAYGPQVGSTPSQAEIARAAEENRRKELELDNKAQEATKALAVTGELAERRQAQEARDAAKTAQTMRKLIGKEKPKSDLYVARGDSIRKFTGGDRARGEELDKSRGSYSKVKMTSVFDRIQREAAQQELDQMRAKLQLFTSLGLDASGRPLKKDTGAKDVAAILANVGKAAFEGGMATQDLLDVLGGDSPMIALIAEMYRRRQAEQNK